MTSQRTDFTGQPLLLGYLSELGNALDHLPPEERAEIISGVRDHMREVLPDDFNEADVRNMLARMGPVEHVVENASVNATSKGEGGSSGRDWVARSAAILAGLSLLLVLVPYVAIPLALISLGVAAVHMRNRQSNRRLTLVSIGLAGLTLTVSLLVGIFLLQVDDGLGEPRVQRIEDAEVS